MSKLMGFFLGMFAAIAVITPSKSEAMMQETCGAPYSVTIHTSSGDVTYTYQDCQWIDYGGGGGGYSGGIGTDPYSGGGGGGSTKPTIRWDVVIRAPDNPYNSETGADCSSETAVRQSHAVQDVNAYLASHILSRPPIGAIFKVKYPSGQTEGWIYTGVTGDAALWWEPVGGIYACH